MHLTVVTPERKLIDQEVEEVLLPGSEGYFGVLPGHAPMLSALKVGEISYRHGGRTRLLSVAWGFAEVLPERVRVLADVAERAEDIDAERAARAGERAENRLRQGGGSVDWDRARASLEKAMVRIRIAGGKR